MIDIHTHILHGVDDGAIDFNESVEMLKQQLKQGINRVVLTPHVENRVQKVSSKELKERFLSFQEQISKILPEITLYLGYEVKYSSTKQIDYSKYKYENSNKLLIEFSTMDEDPVSDIIFDLHAKGYEPILAHAERYLYLTDVDFVNIRKTGCIIQINSGSILGEIGSKYKKRAFHLLKQGMVDIIASDAHHFNKRKPNIQKALKKVKKFNIEKKMKEFQI